MNPTGLDRWIRTRPLVLLTACFLAGLIIGQWAGVMWLAWFIGAGLMAAALLVWRKRALIFALALLLGAGWMSLHLVKPTVTAQDGVTLTGQVSAWPVTTERYTRLRLSGASIDGEAVPGQVMLYLYDPIDAPSYGDIITLTANTWLPNDAGNPGGFDYAAWMWRQGAALGATGSGKNVTGIQPGSPSLVGWALSLRQQINDLIAATFPPDTVGVAQALITGDRSGMDEETKSNYRAAGVSHLLALSGLHVSALLWSLYVLLRKCRLSKPVAFWLTMPFMIVYALVVGFPPSVIRACLMYTVGQIARLDGRPRDSLTTMCMSMLPMLIINPLYIQDAGFVLSYCAVTGIALYPVPDNWTDVYVPRTLWRKLRDYVKEITWVSLFGQLGALPATVCLFNQLPVWFLPFNVLLAPMMTLLVPLLVVCTGLGALFPGATAFAQAPAAVIRLFNGVTAWGAGMPFALMNAADWPVWLIGLYAAALFAASPHCRLGQHGKAKHAIRTAIPALAALGLALPLFHVPGGLEITCLDVGQGDGAIIRAQGHSYLIDVGDGTTACDCLLNWGIRPDGIFLSHAHADHAGGLDAIMDAFSPCTIYVSDAWDTSPKDESVEAVWQRVLDEGWPVVYLTAGDEVALSADVTARMWLPLNTDVPDQNSASMVLSVIYGDAVALFTGDLPMTQELNYLPDCTLLKVAHHGSANSTGEIMLAQTSPEAAVISVGRNSYGHPADAVLDRLGDTPTYRTDQMGAITARLEMDGSMEITTYRRRIEN